MKSQILVERLPRDNCLYPTKEWLVVERPVIGKGYYARTRTIIEWHKSYGEACKIADNMIARQKLSCRSNRLVQGHYYSSREPK